jgi:drug/metabolite transporter (DMT)-like permease
MNNLRRLMAFGLLCAIWGTTWMASYELQGHCPPFRAAAIRYGVAAAALLLIALARKRPPPSAQQLRAMAILGCTLVALPFVLLSLGAQTVSTGTSAVLFAIVPAALALLAGAGRGVPPERRIFYGTLAGFGAVVLAMSGALSLTPSRGLVTVSIAIFSVGWSFALAKDELQGAGVLVSAGVQLAVASLFLIVISLVSERGQSAQWTAESLISLGLLSLIGSAVALPLLYWLLQRSETYQVAAVEWVQPLIAVAEGAVVLHQNILPATFYLGAAAVLACVGVLFSADQERAAPLSLEATGAEPGS